MRKIFIIVFVFVLLLITRIESLSLAKLANELCQREPQRSYCKEIQAADARDAEAAKKENEEVVRRAPVDFANLAAQNSGAGTPLAFGRSTGNNADFEVPGLGSLGVGQSISDIAKFIPRGTADETPNGGTFNIGDSKYGFSQSETGTGKTRHRTNTLSLGGIGTFEVGKKAEQGAGIANFLDKFIPKIPEPPGGIENSNPAVREEIETSNSNYYSNAYSGNSEKYKALIREYEKKSAKAFASKTQTAEEEHKDIFKDDDEKEVDGFIEQEAFEEEKLQPQVMSVQQLQAGHVPLSQLGLKKEQVQALCQKFSVIAAQVCYGHKIEPQYLDKCRGYQSDCAGYIAEAKPLGAIANSFNSGVGITYFNVGVNGIPYYAVNEEGAVNAGHNGKVDFGSWGGGYSDTIGVKDYWRQTAEAGANWYEGLYGYKTGWHVPIASQFGVEGGGGTHVHVPLKEGSLGQPIQVSNGYHVGPYVGLAENIGVDWYNGGVSASKGFALPIVGVNGNAGTSVGFPSLGTVMRAMGPYMVGLPTATRSFGSGL